jgi:hypothetical protein
MHGDEKCRITHFIVKSVGKKSLSRDEEKILKWTLNKQDVRIRTRV